MKKLGNIIWCVPVGFVVSLVWFLLGAVLCVTIIGIPFGVQCFKIGKLNMWPFGKRVDTCYEARPFLNLIWAPIGCVVALLDYIIGIVLCVTLIGIPFGKQCFKLARISLHPFAALVTPEEN